MMYLNHKEKILFESIYIIEKFKYAFGSSKLIF